MSAESPAVILYDGSGNPIAVQNGVAIPANTSSLIMAGSDGTNSRYITVDASGRIVVAGSGVAGTTSGGVLTIQGVAGGVVVPVSGTVTATNPSVSTTSTAPPASATYMGGSVTTAAPAYTTGQLNALSLTTSGALRVDSAATTQPVSGTITANAGTGNFNVLGTGAAGTAASGVVTVQGIASMTPVQVSQTTAANLNATIVGVGTAGTPSGGVLTIQGSASGTAIPVTGSFNTKSSTGTITSVAASATSVTLLATNTNRISATLFNDSASLLYVAFAASASITAFTIKLFPSCYYELPISYTGIITGIWTTAVGSCRITELT